MTTTAMIFGLPGWAEVLIVVILGVILFGRRLPEIGRNVGRGIVEFQKGVKEIGAEMNEHVEKRGRPSQIDHDR